MRHKLKKTTLLGSLLFYLKIIKNTVPLISYEDSGVVSVILFAVVLQLHILPYPFEWEPMIKIDEFVDMA